jgi:hypothetical protein
MEEHFIGKVATKAIIVKGDKILMTRDNKDAAIWDLPGGRINVDSLIYSEQLRHTDEGSSHLFITCKSSLIDLSQPFRIPSEELAEVKWVDEKTIGELKTYDNCMRAISTYFRNKDKR